MASRSFKVIHPRKVASPYLLSGLLKCGVCGRSMMGQSAKSGTFHYYVCGTRFRQGRGLCDMKAVRTRQLEELVLEKVKYIVLTKENLEELVRLVNEELASSLEGANERIRYLRGQRSDILKRLERLYDSLESGTLEPEDLAPRIKEQRQKLDVLERAEMEAKQMLDAGRVELVDREMVMGYLGRLGEVLQYGTPAERRTFLKSFIQAIEVNNSEATIRYSLPLPSQLVPMDPGVLAIVHDGGPTQIHHLNRTTI